MTCNHDFSRAIAGRKFPGPAVVRQCIKCGMSDVWASFRPQKGQEVATAKDLKEI